MTKPNRCRWQQQVEALHLFRGGNAERIDPVATVKVKRRQSREYGIPAYRNHRTPGLESRAAPPTAQAEWWIRVDERLPGEQGPADGESK